METTEWNQLHQVFYLTDKTFDLTGAWTADAKTESILVFNDVASKATQPFHLAMV